MGWRLAQGGHGYGFSTGPRMVEVLTYIGAIWDPRSDPEWTPKSLKNRLGPPGRPGDPKDYEAFREQFWSRLGPMLERFGNPFGTNFAAQFGTYFQTLRLATPAHDCVPASLGWRVSALALKIKQ